MTHLFTDHFRGICKDQGFDWETGWRGNLIEVLDITPDPGCPVCGEKGKKKRLALEREMQQQTAGLSTQPHQPQNNTKTDQQVQTAALLMDDSSEDLHKAVSIIGILKAGKTYVPLDPSLPGEKLSDIFSQSRARIIVTDNKNLGKAKKIRDRVNKAIPLLDVTDIDNSVSREKPDVEILPADIAYILFPPDPPPPRQSVKQSHNQVLDFLHRCTRHLQDNTGSPPPLPPLSLYHHELKAPMLELLGSLLNADVPFAFPGNRETSDYSPPRLKEYLLKELPEYMIPSHFIQLEKIPLTPNGKIDQKALPEPETAVTVEKYSPPTNETEEKLVRIWSELLGIEKEKIGVQHNFFELGGNSLNLILLVSAIHKEFGIEAAINQIFDNPTIKDIANSLGAKDFADKPVMLLNRLNEQKLFLFPPQIAYGVFYMGLAYIIDDYSFYAFSFIEEEDRIKKYVDVMKDLQPEGPFIMFGYSAAGRLIFEITKALENQGREVSDIIFLDCIYYENKPFIIEDEFMAEHYKFIEEFLENMGVPFLKEQVMEKSGKFIKYCQNTSPLEPVNAVIHLILTEEARETEDPHCWDKLTGKTVMTYDGYGPHMEVFSPGRLEKNAGVLKEVLTRIESRKKNK
ncbi:phosphopantetheine-binding protein [Acidobacteriota bacterium]